MADFTKFHAYVHDVAKGASSAFDLDADTFKVYLTNAEPDAATHSAKSDLTEITMTNEANHGTGGGDMQASFAASGGTATLACQDVTFEASGGTVGPFRYAVVYDDTTEDDLLVGYWDYGQAVTLQDGETFVVDTSDVILTVS